MIEPYPQTYDSGKRGIYITIGVIAIAFISCISLHDVPVAFLIMFSLFATLFLFHFLWGFQKAKLYEDRMELRDIWGNLLMLLYFEEISRIGVVHTRRPQKIWSSDEMPGDDEEREKLVVFLKDGSEHEIDVSRFEQMRAICTFIQQKAEHNKTS
jgi:hypothetical protein